MLEHELLNPSQHGFVKGRSGLSNLLLALDAITEALDRGDEVSKDAGDVDEACTVSTNVPA